MCINSIGFGQKLYAVGFFSFSEINDAKAAILMSLLILDCISILL